MPLPFAPGQPSPHSPCVIEAAVSGWAAVLDEAMPADESGWAAAPLDAARPSEPPVAPNERASDEEDSIASLFEVVEMDALRATPCEGLALHSPPAREAAEVAAEGEVLSSRLHLSSRVTPSLIAIMSALALSTMVAVVVLPAVRRAGRCPTGATSSWRP